jgi:hypothetical protein
MVKIIKSFLQTSKQISEFYSLPSSLDLVKSPTLTEKLISKIKIGSQVKVAVKSFNKSSGRVECLFVDELESNNFDANTSLMGHAYVDLSDTVETPFKIGAKFNALVMAFDPLARVFCLTLDKKKVKFYAKNFDESFRTGLVCKLEQSIKAEVIYVSQWFCIVGLKAHALGRLAIMPLFRNDFTQLNTFRALNDETGSTKSDTIDSKIKKEQVLAVSSASFESLLPTNSDEAGLDKNSKKSKSSNKDDKRFAYFSVGQVLKITLKTDDDQLNLAIAFKDLSNVKRNKKFLFRQLAILNETHESAD